MNKDPWSIRDLTAITTNFRPLIAIHPSFCQVNQVFSYKGIRYKIRSREIFEASDDRESYIANFVCEKLL